MSYLYTFTLIQSGRENGSMTPRQPPNKAIGKVPIPQMDILADEGEHQDT